jgi:drug/metabolite transporter (DMT)-like permease
MITPTWQPVAEMTPAPSMLLVAVPTAVVGAASFGLASAIQQRATKRVPTVRPLDPRLLVSLAREPLWVLGVVTVLFGLSLQLVALAFGPLVLVQPLLVTGLLFGTMFSVWLAGRRPDRQILVGALACVVGLAAFLTLARPRGGSGHLPDLPQLLPLTVVLTAIIAGCLVVAVAARFSGTAHVAALAVATGVLYGVTAGLMKVVTGQIRTGGLIEIFHHPMLYIVCVIGPVGFLLSQNTFQQGVLMAPALAVITVVDPLVGFVIGVAWLDEEIVTTTPILVGEVLAALVLIAGITVLARRAIEIRREVEAAGNGGISPRKDTPWG